MGSDRKMRPYASRLVEELRDEWDEIHDKICGTECPFQKELDANSDNSLWCNPLNENNCNEHCLADVGKCEAYMTAKDDANRAIRFVIALLEEHRSDYEAREFGD